MTTIVLVALSVSAMSMTIAESGLFKYLRDVLNDVPFLDKLVHCPYCLSHWLAFVFVIHISDCFMIWIINSFAVVTLASISSIGISFFLERIDHE
jgi:hypothetical protein